ncbi:MAG: hypothetical protein IT211_02080 [Armatimonadetes bacterium]|nr:hypothetical protein [Armatimonadota bacterium]
MAQLLFRSLFIALLLSAGGIGNHAIAQQPQPTQGAVRLLRADDSGITAQLANLRAIVSKQGNSVAVAHNAFANLLPGDSSRLPGVRVTVAIPFDAVDLQILPSPAGQRDTLLLPAPLPFLKHESQRAQLGTPYVKRGVRMMEVILRPLRAEGNRLIVEPNLTFAITWRRTGGVGKQAGEYRENPDYERTLAQTVLNFQQAKRWRGGWPTNQSTKQGAALQAAVTITGGMGEAMVLLTPTDGVYSITGAEVAAAGGHSVIGKSIADLRLWNRTASVPMFVDDRGSNGQFDPDDRIEFTARRNQSPEGFYFDQTTDTNAYLLRWDGSGTEQPRVQAIAATNASQQLQSVDSTLHFEQDKEYFGGMNVNGSDEFTLHVNERVQNERWYWSDATYIRDGGWIEFPFTCFPYYQHDGRVTLSIRLAGINFTDHPLKFVLNAYSTVADTVLTNDTGDVTFRFSIPSSYLFNGRNVLRVEPGRPPGAIPNSVKIDYFEISGAWLPASSGGSARVKISESGQPIRVVVGGFSNPPTVAASAKGRAAITNPQRGVLFRFTSRHFPGPERINLQWRAEYGDSSVGSASWEQGLHIAEVDANNGTILRRSWFQTFDGGKSQAEYQRAVEFLNAVRDGNFIVAGFSSGGGYSNEFSDALRTAFKSLGSRNIERYDMTSTAWSFVAIKGNSASAQEFMKTDFDNNRGITFNAFFPMPENSTFPGLTWQATATLVGEAGEEFIFDSPKTPLLRWHPKDELVAETNQADMIIITHKAFRQASEELANYRRQRSGLNVRVVDVETVYDEFNDGIKSGYAIRRFLHYASQSWAQPKPLYVLLVGDASWDPMFKADNSTMIDYIPSLGIPVSDYLLTIKIGDTSQASDYYIGRFPVRTSAEADNMVRKVIEYENLPPDAWNKRFVFLAGGGDANQRDRFKELHEQIATTYVLAPEFCGDTGMVVRTSPENRLAFPDDLDADWTRSEINQGTLWVTFSGHGAVDIFDLNFGYPEDLSVGNRYFVLTTYSCQTGAYAEPGLVNRNERFVTSHTGAVAAIGGTSFSYTDIDQHLKQGFVSHITAQYQRTIGQVLTDVKWEMFADAVGDVTDFWYLGAVRQRNHLLMYCLLGDPAMQLASRSTPELAVREQSNTVTITNMQDQTPTIGDTAVKVRVRLWDFGRPIQPTGNPDSAVTVAATIVDRLGSEQRVTLPLDGICYFTDAVLTLPITGKPGEYTIRIEIDPEKKFTESYRDDNLLTLRLRIRGSQPLPIEPLPYGRVPSPDSVVIRLLNPPSGPGAIIAVDTTPLFQTPFTNSDVGTMELQELTTTWSFSIPQSHRGASTYWWRAYSSTGDTAAAALFPLIESFTVQPAGPAEFIIRGKNQLQESQISDVVVDERGIGPALLPIPITLYSVGQTFIDENTRVPDTKIVEMRIGGNPGINYAPLPLDGVHVLVLPPNSITPSAKRVYDFNANRETFRNFRDFVRDTVQPGQLVMVAFSHQQYDKAFDQGHSDFLREALGLLGSRVAGRFLNEESFVMIGGKGIPATEVRELWSNTDSLRKAGVKPPYRLTLIDTLVLVPRGSVAFPTVGPATAWQSAVVDVAGPPVQTVIYGLRRDGRRDTLIRSDQSSIDLSGVNVALYPRLEAAANFGQDSTQRLRSIAVTFDPSPELAITPSTFRIAPDSVLQGFPAVASASMVNLSRKYPANNVPVMLWRQLESGTSLEDSIWVSNLAPLDSAVTGLRIATDKLKKEQQFTAVVNPSDLPAEPYTQNNLQRASLRIGIDSTQPELTIYADRNRLIDGDIVRPIPEFEVRLFDNSILKLDSVTSVVIYLDIDKIDARKTGTRWETFAKTGDNHRASLFYTPSEKLLPGEHSMKVVLTDATGNKQESDIIIFYVEQNLTVRQVANVPNPFPNKTTFTFMIGGEQQPTEGEIGIFTVSGRKVKTIPIDPARLKTGFNKVEWDGLDADGDRLANGVYYYRVRIGDGSATQEVIEKLVVMR